MVKNWIILNLSSILVKYLSIFIAYLTPNTHNLGPLLRHLFLLPFHPPKDSLLIRHMARHKIVRWFSVFQLFGGIYTEKGVGRYAQSFPLALKRTNYPSGCILEDFHVWDLMVVVGFLGGLFGCVLKVVFPNVSPISVAGIFRGQESEPCLCSGVCVG